MMTISSQPQHLGNSETTAGGVLLIDSTMEWSAWDTQVTLSRPTGG